MTKGPEKVKKKKTTNKTKKMLLSKRRSFGKSVETHGFGAYQPRDLRRVNTFHYGCWTRKLLGGDCGGDQRL